VDESFREHDSSGFYVLAAAVFEADADEARLAMLALRGRRRVGKLHWNEMMRAIGGARVRSSAGSVDSTL
jgi:hypothetical protein